MPNGCMCCRVRGDLVDAIKKIISKPVDGVIIEISGLSEVAPVIQTFFVDDFIQSRMQIDAVLCVVDSQLVYKLLKENNTDELNNQDKEIMQLLSDQLNLSDVILLNKTDKLDKNKVEELHQELKFINTRAKVVECQYGDVELDSVLNINSFSFETALDVDDYFN